MIRCAGSAGDFRANRHWIWTDAMTYYLERHRLLPEPELVAHIPNRYYDL